MARGVGFVGMVLVCGCAAGSGTEEPGLEQGAIVDGFYVEDEDPVPGIEITGGLPGKETASGGIIDTPSTGGAKTGGQVIGTGGDGDDEGTGGLNTGGDTSSGGAGGLDTGGTSSGGASSGGAVGDGGTTGVGGRPRTYICGDRWPACRMLGEKCGQIWPACATWTIEESLMLYGRPDCTWRIVPYVVSDLANTGLACEKEPVTQRLLNAWPMGSAYGTLGMGGRVWKIIGGVCEETELLPNYPYYYSVGEPLPQDELDELDPGACRWE